PWHVLVRPSEPVRIIFEHKNHGGLLLWAEICTYQYNLRFILRPYVDLFSRLVHCSSRLVKFLSTFHIHPRGIFSFLFAQFPFHVLYDKHPQIVFKVCSFFIIFFMQINLSELVKPWNCLQLTTSPCYLLNKMFWYLPTSGFMFRWWEWQGVLP